MSDLSPCRIVCSLLIATGIPSVLSALTVNIPSATTAFTSKTANLTARRIGMSCSPQNVFHAVSPLRQETDGLKLSTITITLNALNVQSVTRTLKDSHSLLREDDLSARVMLANGDDELMNQFTLLASIRHDKEFNLSFPVFSFSLSFPSNIPLFIISFSCSFIVAVRCHHVFYH